jgi:FdhE protein
VTPSPFGQRAARARLLADRYPAAAELLRFYARLAEYQGALGAAPDTAATDEDRVLAVVPAFLSWLVEEAPAALSAAATTMRALGAGKWRAQLEARRPGAGEGSDDPAAFVLEALWQPLAQRAAAARSSEAPERALGGRRCPACEGLPVVGALREEAQGARRSLICAACLTEWVYLRVSCPGCGEDRHDALPVFTAEQFGHMRVEACDSCRRYLKTVDLTKDGLAIPIVDDLASLPLDLWARDQGYARLRANLLRT